MPMKIVLLILILAPLNLFGQAASHCSLPVVLLDKNGEFAPHVLAQDLLLRARNQSIAISSLEELAPQNVVLFLDTSSQMARFRHTRKDQLLLLYWLASSAPNNVSLVIYSGKIEAVIQGREKVQAELMARGNREESFGGDSDFVPLARKAVEAMLSTPGDVIFAIGPPRYRASSDSRRDLLHALQKRGVRLFYMENYYAPPAEVSGLHSEALKSGGMSFIWHTRFRGMALTDFRQMFVNEMYRFYRLEFDVSPDFKEAVEVRYQGSTKGMSAFSPRSPVCQ